MFYVCKFIRIKTLTIFFQAIGKIAGLFIIFNNRDRDDNCFFPINGKTSNIKTVV